MSTSTNDAGQQGDFKYYCHLCRKDFTNVQEEFNCVECGSGFIEIVPSSRRQSGRRSSQSQTTSQSTSNFHDLLGGMVDPPGIDLDIPPTRGRHGRTGDARNSPRVRTFRFDTMALRNRGPSRNSGGYTGGYTGGTSNSGSTSSTTTHTNLSSPIGIGSQRGSSRNTTTGADARLPFEQMLQDFISNISQIGGTGYNVNQPVSFFLGNPGDYAWGREGLDTIVTQLLNQMDHTGPPPLSRDSIRAIPTIQISESQVVEKLQCSVCWEDFILSENVRQLSCEHIYHECCIFPWLELHGTCPICRKYLHDERSMLHTSPESLGNLLRSPRPLPDMPPVSGPITLPFTPSDILHPRFNRLQLSNSDRSMLTLLHETDQLINNINTRNRQIRRELRRNSISGGAAGGGSSSAHDSNSNNSENPRVRRRSRSARNSTSIHFRPYFYHYDY